jgi:hypothetical protein
VNKQTISDILLTLSEYLEELRAYRALVRDEVIGDRQARSAVRYAFQTAIR